MRPCMVFRKHTCIPWFIGTLKHWILSGSFLWHAMLLSQPTFRICLISVKALWLPAWSSIGLSSTCGLATQGMDLQLQPFVGWELQTDIAALDLDLEPQPWIQSSRNSCAPYCLHVPQWVAFVEPQVRIQDIRGAATTMSRPLVFSTPSAAKPRPSNSAISTPTLGRLSYNTQHQTTYQVHCAIYWFEFVASHSSHEFVQKDTRQLRGCQQYCVSHWGCLPCINLKTRDSTQRLQITRYKRKYEHTVCLTSLQGRFTSCAHMKCKTNSRCLDTKQVFFRNNHVYEPCAEESMQQNIFHCPIEQIVGAGHNMENLAIPCKLQYKPHQTRYRHHTHNEWFEVHPKRVPQYREESICIKREKEGEKYMLCIFGISLL